MKAIRLLATALAVWMSCSLAVGAVETAHAAPDALVCVVKKDTADLPEDARRITDDAAATWSFHRGDRLGLPHAGSSVTIAVGGESTLWMNTQVDQTLVGRYPHANFTFLNGSGSSLGLGALLRIAANGRRHLYRYSEEYENWSDDLSESYSEGEDAFLFRTDTLGRYLISDVDLLDQCETNLSWAPNDMVYSAVNLLADRLGKSYSNHYAIVSFGTKHEKMGKTVTFQIKVWGGSPRLDTKKLRVYAYDPQADKLVRLTNARPTYDSRGEAFSFTSEYRGMFVITDSGWKRK